MDIAHDINSLFWGFFFLFFILKVTGFFMWSITLANFMQKHLGEIQSLMWFVLVCHWHIIFTISSMNYPLSSENEMYKVQLTEYNINSYRVCVVYLLLVSLAYCRSGKLIPDSAGIYHLVKVIAGFLRGIFQQKSIRTQQACTWD